VIYDICMYVYMYVCVYIHAYILAGVLGQCTASFAGVLDSARAVHSADSPRS
jgi:hypothetical protein